MTFKKITVLQLNDLHGYLEPHHELFWTGGYPMFREAGGLSRVATLVEEARTQNPGGVILLDNGDTIHGTFPVVCDKGEKFMPILNGLGFDAWTAHWDFAYGAPYLRKYSEGLDYPLLAVNCYDAGSEQLVFRPYRIFERHGIRIAVIGIASNIVDKVMPASFHTGVRFTLSEDELRKSVEHVRGEERAQLVVVLSHLGYPQELKMLSRVYGIDVLLSGHTHNRIRNARLVNGAIIIQSGCHGSFIGRIDLEVSSDGKVKGFKHRLIEVDETIPEDEEMYNLVESVVLPHREMLDTVIGETRIDLHRNLVLESTMDNLLLEAIQGYTGADVAFSNGWRYGAPIPRGKITMGDIWQMVPSNPPVSVCNITGREIWKMMELNLERTFSPDPYEQMGGYVKRCMGLNLYFKVENPNGHRINRLFVNGRPIDLGKKYVACYVSSQGVGPEYGSDKTDLDINAIDVIRWYLESEKLVTPSLRNTVVPV